MQASATIALTSARPLVVLKLIQGGCQQQELITLASNSLRSVFLVPLRSAAVPGVPPEWPSCFHAAQPPPPHSQQPKPHSKAFGTVCTCETTLAANLQLGWKLCAVASKSKMLVFQDGVVNAKLGADQTPWHICPTLSLPLP